jgi:predicted transcriptional regulator
MYRFIIRCTRPPARKDAEKDLEWFCKSLGLMGVRDKKRTSFKIFKILLKESRKGNVLTCEEIASRVHLSRAAVHYHLKNMVKSGLVINIDNAFELRMRNLQNIVDEIQKDIERALSDIRRIAQDIDKEFKMPVR